LIAEYERMIGLRILKKDSEAIESLLQNGKYKSVSQIARIALTEFLSKCLEVTPEASCE
jgi:Arc/MetJ-type ribon-helix-helix transcriptional regulator